MRFCCLLFFSLFLCFTPLAAQSGAPTLNDATDPIAPPYVPVYTRINRRLLQLGYDTDRAGNAVMVRGEYNLSYTGPNIDARFRRDLRQLKQVLGPNNVRVLGQCGCTDDYRIFNLYINPINGEERGKASSIKVAQTLGQEEHAQPNYYLIPDLNHVKPGGNAGSLPKNFTVLPPAVGGTPVDIAVLDSGLDPNYQDGTRTGGHAPLTLWENAAPNDPADPFCFADDLIGWDFVNKDNAPLDDNSHGTHVSSGIANTLATNYPTVPYRLMPLKVLDGNGVGTTFRAACATLYATHHRVDILHASWGFYGEDDAVLRETFRRAEQGGIFVSNSAGNMGVDTRLVKHYPSGFAFGNAAMRNVLFVGASRSNRLDLPWAESNYRSSRKAGTDYLAAPGTNVVALVPSYFGSVRTADRKTGTSMAAPYLTAAAAAYLAAKPGVGGATVRREILRLAEKEGTSGLYGTSVAKVPFKAFSTLSF